MSRTSKYYIPKAIANAERKLAELHLLRDIEAIERKLELLETLREIYPAIEPAHDIH